MRKVNPNYEVVGEIENIEEAKIGIVGGSGGTRHSIIQETLAKGCDLFITGSSMIHTEIYAYEKNLAMIKLGHTASEKWGVYALGEKLLEEFSVEIERIKEKNW